MAKRVLFVVMIVAALLVLAAPAMAFSGYRSDFTLSTSCKECHSDKYTEWQTTAHSQAELNTEQVADGPSCGGCHASNYDPEKAIPGEDGLYPTEVTENGAFSELGISCSMCHYGGGVQHNAPAANLANADICAQGCHAQRGQSVASYPLYDGSSSTFRYVVGFKMLGEAPDWVPQPITEVLNVSTPEVPVSQNYYKLGDETLPWGASTHDGGALQYPEWALEGHANALNALKAIMGPNPPASCLECHSQDYRMAPDDAKPTGAEAKYGITCTTCHDPHEEGVQKNIWNDNNGQLTATRQELCIECHNAELPEDGIAKPGSAVHHPMKEMMNGTGAIDVPQGSPSVHKGKCVQCHMPPTGLDRTTGELTENAAANHTFQIITPDVAANALTTNAVGGAKRHMPYSACTTCHSRPNDQAAQWVQGALDDRQAAMHKWDAKVTVALTAAAKRLGYKDVATANTKINKIPMKKWSKGQMNFQKAFTNQYYVQSEGSWGIHNWEYARTIILKALDEAKAVRK